MKIKDSELNFLEYLKELINQAGDWLSGGGILGLLSFILSFFAEGLLVKILRYFPLVPIILIFFISSYKIWFDLKEKIKDYSHKLNPRLELKISREKRQHYTILQITNIGTDDIVDLSMLVDGRKLQILDKPDNIVFAHEIDPHIIKQKETLSAHFPQRKSEVTITGKGRISEKPYSFKQNI